METTPLSAIEFSLPPELEASAPPEARGLRRDEVRLMVSHYSTDEVRHTRFHQLDKYLDEGDVIVINTSPTRNAALLATRVDAAKAERIATRFPTLDYDPVSRLLRNGSLERAPGRVAVVCAGSSDVPVAEEAAGTLSFFGVEVTWK